jgi:hypothetical protein
MSIPPQPDEEFSDVGIELRRALGRTAPPLAPVLALARRRRRRRVAGTIGGGLVVVVLVASASAALLRERDSTPRSIVTGSGSTIVVPDETVVPDTATTGMAATTTVAIAPDGSTPSLLPSGRWPNEVRVMVVNGVGVPGRAGATTSRLVPFGFATLPPADADQLYEPTTFFYRDGYDEDAKALARLLGVVEPVEAHVAPIPTPPPVRGTRGAANAPNADVLVLRGTDGLLQP